MPDALRKASDQEVSSAGVSERKTERLDIVFSVGKMNSLAARAGSIFSISA
jgi:hypothetical protein